MKKIRTFLLFLTFSIPAFGAAYTNTASGLFSAGATWVGGVAPSASGDTWMIVSNTVVTYDVNNSGTTGWGACVITNGGELRMTNSTYCWLLMNGTLSGAGKWTIGSLSSPISFTSSNTPAVIVQFTNNTQCTMLGTNKMGWYGDYSHVTNTSLAATLSSGGTSITVSNMPANIGSNDIVFVGSSNIVGQAGEYYLVGSVTGNTITFASAPLIGIQTNTLWGSVLRTTASATRGTNSCVSFLSCPVVVMESVQSTAAMITLSATNVLSGIRFQNINKGVCTSASCNGWTVSNCTINNCSYGGLGNNICNGWTVSNCTINNCNYGGLGTTSCNGWTVSNCTINNCSYGGLSSSCNGWTVSNCTINNCSSGGLGYNTCNGWTVSNCTVNNCSSGGLGTTSSGWTVSNCTINNCSSGGLGTTSCTGWTVSNCTINNSSPIFVLCWNNVMYGTASSGDTIPTALVNMPNVFNWTNWTYAPYGTATLTNNIVTYNITNSTIGSYFCLDVRGGCSRSVTVSLALTNNVVYGLYYGVVTPTVPTATTTVSASTLGSWTNQVLSYSNTGPTPVQTMVYISAAATNNTTGQSIVSPGSDRLVTIQ